jgi:hypothetical protein
MVTTWIIQLRQFNMGPEQLSKVSVSVEGIQAFFLNG